MQYETRDGRIIEMKSLTYHESELLLFLRREYDTTSYTPFATRTALEIQHRLGEGWQNHPLTHIANELALNDDIRSRRQAGSVLGGFID